MAASDYCLVTTVRNTSGVDKSFSFLGKHGRRLTANQQWSEPGDLIQKLAYSPRKYNALVSALENGLLGIVRTPAPHYFDPVTDHTRVLSLSNGSLSAVDPCWGHYISA